MTRFSQFHIQLKGYHQLNKRFIIIINAHASTFNFPQAFDFGDSNGALKTPSEYDSMMYAPAYNAGARIFSNSWGGIGMSMYF